MEGDMGGGVKMGSASLLGFVTEESNPGVNMDEGVVRDEPSR
jgi:hypothetical protein